jgi:hypothetical protein
MQRDDGGAPGNASRGPKGQNSDNGEAAQIIVDAIRRHVPTASRDQAEATAKDAVGRLEKTGKLNRS